MISKHLVVCGAMMLNAMFLEVHALKSLTLECFSTTTGHKMLTNPKHEPEKYEVNTKVVWKGAFEKKTTEIEKIKIIHDGKANNINFQMWNFERKVGSYTYPISETRKPFDCRINLPIAEIDTNHVSLQFASESGYIVMEKSKKAVLKKLQESINKVLTFAELFVEELGPERCHQITKDENILETMKNPSECEKLNMMMWKTTDLKHYKITRLEIKQARDSKSPVIHIEGQWGGNFVYYYYHSINDVSWGEYGTEAGKGETVLMFQAKKGSTDNRMPRLCRKQYHIKGPVYCLEAIRNELIELERIKNGERVKNNEACAA